MKRKNETHKKEKILAKLVVRKEEIKFNVVDYCFIDDVIGDEHLGCFPFGNDPLLSVMVYVP
jgi:hypothetical protein